MTVLGGVTMQLTVVLGSTRLPLRDLLKMGRGATIPLDRGSQSLSELHIAGRRVASGRIVLDGDRVAFEVARLNHMEA